MSRECVKCPKVQTSKRHLLRGRSRYRLASMTFNNGSTINGTALIFFSWLEDIKVCPRITDLLQKFLDEI